MKAKKTTFMQNNFDIYPSVIKFVENRGEVSSSMLRIKFRTTKQMADEMISSMKKQKLIKDNKGVKNLYIWTKKKTTN